MKRRKVEKAEKEHWINIIIQAQWLTATLIMFQDQ